MRREQADQPADEDRDQRIENGDQDAANEEQDEQRLRLANEVLVKGEQPRGRGRRGDGRSEQAARGLAWCRDRIDDSFEGKSRHGRQQRPARCAVNAWRVAIAGKTCAARNLFIATRSEEAPTRFRESFAMTAARARPFSTAWYAVGRGCPAAGRGGIRATAGRNITDKQEQVARLDVPLARA